MLRSEYYYLRDQVVEVDAAAVGLSRLHWSKLTPEQADDLTLARRIMADNQFDLMPVEDSGGDVRSYVKTVVWGDYSAVARHDVTEEDVISQRMPLEEVIRGFAKEDREFYFLSRFEHITGFVTVVNLNGKHARVFLYSLIAEVETVVSELVAQGLEEGRFTKKDILSLVGDETRQDFESAAGGHVEPSLPEFLYLRDLKKVVSLYDLYRPLGYTSRTRFKKEIGRLIELRNRVAHPTRALLRTHDAVHSLWRDIRVMEDALTHWFESSEGSLEAA